MKFLCYSNEPNENSDHGIQKHLIETILNLTLRPLENIEVDLALRVLNGLLLSAGYVIGSELTTLYEMTCDNHERISLSGRQQEILLHLIRGRTAKEIAARLHLSKRTVEHHIENIKLKTNCDTKYALIDKYYWKLSDSNEI